MDTLIQRMIRVPKVPTLEIQESHARVESSVMAATRGRGGRGPRGGGRGGRGCHQCTIARGWVTLRKTVTPYMVFLLRLPMSLRLTLLSPNSLRTSIKSTYVSSPAA